MVVASRWVRGRRGGKATSSHEWIKADSVECHVTVLYFSETKITIGNQNNVDGLSISVCSFYFRAITDDNIRKNGYYYRWKQFNASTSWMSNLGIFKSQVPAHP